MRRCDRIGGEFTAMMEVSSGGGVRSTDHTEVLSTSIFNTKRRKVDATEVLESCRPDVQLEIQNRGVVHYQEVSISTVEYETAGHVLSSLCSSNDSSDQAVKHSSGTLDLKVKIQFRKPKSILNISLINSCVKLACFDFS